MIPRLTKLVNDRCLMVPLLTTEELCDRLEALTYDPQAERTLLSVLRWAEHELSKAQGEDEPSKKTRVCAEDFDRFWKAYPRKQAKKAAFRAWKNATDKPEINTILKAIALQLESDNWTKDNGSYICMPSTWLNQGRWDDQVTSSSQFDYTTGAQ